MPIPSQNEFLLPFLNLLSDGQSSTRAQMLFRLAQHFGISQGKAAHDEYLTKLIILEVYDQMAATLPLMHVPAPKDESATYAVPDVSQWVTWLNPPTADPSVAHQNV